MFKKSYKSYDKYVFQIHIYIGIYMYIYIYMAYLLKVRYALVIRLFVRLAAVTFPQGNFHPMSSIDIQFQPPMLLLLSCFLCPCACVCRCVCGCVSQTLIGT